MNLDKKTITEKIKKFEAGIGWYQDIDLGNGIHTKTRSIWGEDIDHPKRRWLSISKGVPDDMTGLSVLDVGCNAGFCALQAKQRNAKYVCGVDLKQEYIEQAKFCAEVKGVDIDFRVLSVYELDKLEQQFDVVFFVGLLYHCRYLLKAVELVSRITKHKLIVESAIHFPNTPTPLIRFVRTSQYKGPQGVDDERLPGCWHPNMTAMKDLFYEHGFSKIETLSERGGRGAILAEK